MDYPELEIFLYRRGEAEYSAVFKWRKPGDDGDHREEIESIRLDATVFDEAALRQDSAAYGLRLGQQLFEQPLAKEAFQKARPPEGPLRLRLCFDQRSLKLHRLRWETLCLPSADPARPPECLATSGTVFLSRHLFSGDMRPVRLRPQSEMKALIVVANPTNVGEYSAGDRPLASIDVAGELQVAAEGLTELRPEILPKPGEHVTLERLLEALRAEPDILYLVCHGAMVDGEPKLLLQRDDGTGRVVSGMELIRAFQRLQSLPRLVVLVSCQSAQETAAEKKVDAEAEKKKTDADAEAEKAAVEKNAGERSVLAALGPRLAEAGVPAVIAMQGNLRMDTAKAFFKSFFSVLRGSGQVDEAVCAGRRAVEDEQLPESWVPVLFTRLVEGRIWFRKGLKDGADDWWPQLLRQVKSGICVPILGSGMLEPFVGSTRELASRLAQAEGYPPALSGREDLPDVLQFIATMRNDFHARTQLVVLMEEALRGRWPTLPADKNLEQLLEAAWQIHQEKNPHEPHRYLAGLGAFKSIISTNPDRLMERALEAAGKNPRTFSFRWDKLPFVDIEGDQPSEATTEAPHIYQLYGQLSELDSVVLTEDNYFQFLTSMTRRGMQKKDDVQKKEDLVDTLLRGTLAARGLLFLGFRLTDWDFRTLFRLLVEQNGSGRRVNLTHMAVQIDPEDGTHRDAVQARLYIEKQFTELIGDVRQRGKIAIYWGSAEDFIKDLHERWPKTR